MEITVNINETAPKPRVINLRQYSSGVDRVTFVLNTCPIPEGISGAIVSNELIQEITANVNGTNTIALWEIAPEFTSESGCFEVQLRLEGEDKVWLSDKIILIISRSTEGNTIVSPNNELISVPQLSIDAIVNKDIIFKYEEE